MPIMADVPPKDFEERVRFARKALLDLYLSDPDIQAAHILEVFERTIAKLRAERKAQQKDA